MNCAGCRRPIHPICNTTTPAGRVLCPACADQRGARRQRLLVAIGADARTESTAAGDLDEWRRQAYASEDSQRDERRIKHIS